MIYTIKLNQALDNFENSLKQIEIDSPDALALTVFINSCYYSKGFVKNQYDALVKYHKARQSANCLVEVWQDLDSLDNQFNEMIKRSVGILRASEIVPRDLIGGTPI